MAENIQIDAQPDKGTDNVTISEKKSKIKSFGLEKYKVIAPLGFILICAVIMWIMLGSALRSGNNIDGRFVDFESAGSNYIDMDSDGDYTIVTDGEKEEGIWSLKGNLLTFTSQGRTVEGRFVERKYIVISNDDFLFGQIKSGSEEGSEVTSVDGTIYGFGPDGKFYSVVDGARTEIGSYIADGNFIIVTTSDSSITYLNCGDGITAAFYQAV